MQNQSKREKLNTEYQELLKKEREAREAGNYDVIGRLHCQIHEKHEEILKVEFERDKNIKRFNTY